MCAHVNAACESWLNVYGVLQFYMYVNNFNFVGPILILTQTQVTTVYCIRILYTVYCLLYTHVHTLYMDSEDSKIWTPWRPFQVSAYGVVLNSGVI